MWKRALVLPLVVLFCSPPDLGTQAAKAACKDYANAYCSRKQTCSGLEFSLQWPDLSTCQAYETIACVKDVIPPSSGDTVTRLQNCTKDIQATQGSPGYWSCNDFYANANAPPDCAAALGTLPNGAACAKPPECQSGYCSVPTGSTCGTCTPAPGPGAPCRTSPAESMFCSLGSYCNDQGVCAQYAALNGTCDAHQNCEAGFPCIGGTCIAGQTTVGALCGGASGLGCDFLAGLDCNIQTQACTPAIVVGPGQPCGGNLFGQQTVHCGGGGTCLNGTCIAAVGPGAACDVVSGPVCFSGSRCILSTEGGTSGVCAYTDFANCE